MNVIEYDKDVTIEECLELIKNGNDEVRNILIEKCLPLIGSITKQYIGLWDVNDLNQVGMIGVNKAIDSYDKDKSNGASFTSFAYHSIRGEVSKELRAHSRDVRIPYHIVVLQSKIGEKIFEMESKGIPVTNENLSEELGETVRSIELAQRLSTLGRGKVLRLDRSDEENKNVLAGKIESQILNNDIGADEKYVEKEKNKELKKDINQVISTFSPDHKKVLELRYGLNGVEMANTLEEISEKLGVSRERVRQIELLALRTIKNSTSGRRSVLRKYMNEI